MEKPIKKHTHEQLVRLYMWAFSECDRIDKLKDSLDAQADLMNVSRKVEQAIPYTTVEERNTAIAEALEKIDGMVPNG